MFKFSILNIHNMKLPILILLILTKTAKIEQIRIKSAFLFANLFFLPSIYDLNSFKNSERFNTFIKNHCYPKVKNKKCLRIPYFCFEKKNNQWDSSDASKITKNQYFAKL